MKKQKMFLCQTHPALAAEFHPYLNGDLKITDLTADSRDMVIWQDKRGHIWPALVYKRAAGRSCPLCSPKKPVRGKTDLASVRPGLADEWAQDRNYGVTPYDVFAYSNDSYYWRCDKGHVWYAVVSSRSSGCDCPYCTGKKVIPGETDLATVFPELAVEWDYSRNGDVTPRDVAPYSRESFFWDCPRGHVYQARVSNRSMGKGCPYCAHKKVIPGKNDLATTHPEIAAEWDYEKNGSLTPQKVSAGSNRNAFWICSRGHSWPAHIDKRALYGRGCPYCDGKKTAVGETDLATTHPELAMEWDQEKNGELLPQMVTAGSHAKVYWLCPKGHRWRKEVYKRVEGCDCKQCRKEEACGEERPKTVRGRYLLRSYS